MLGNTLIKTSCIEEVKISSTLEYFCNGLEPKFPSGLEKLETRAQHLKMLKRLGKGCREWGTLV